MRTVARMNMEEGVPRRGTLSAIRAALEASDVVFTAEDGDGPGLDAGPFSSRNTT